MPRIKNVFVVLVLWCFVQAPGLAQGSRPAVLDGPEPLAEISRTLQEIEKRLRELRDGQQLDQLMRRIALQRDSLAPLEQQLRNLRTQREGTTDEIGHLRGEMTFLEEAARDDPESAGSYAAGRRQLELRMEVLHDQVLRMDQRILEAESDLRGRQAAILDWEEILDEALGLP